MRVAILAAVFALAACHDRAANVSLTSGWARAAPATARQSVAYLTLRNDGGADVLMAITTPAARSATLHQTTMTNGVMRMRGLDQGLPLPSGKTVRMGSGGVHVMLEDLRQPLVAGTTIPLTLRFARSPARTIDVRVSSEPQS